MGRRWYLGLLAIGTIAATPGDIAKFKAVTFAERTLLASNGELIRRLFSPFAAADLAKKNDAATLAAQPIDPKNEKFGLYVPAQKPAKGYGLLVWVSPLDEAGMPPGWHATLEDRGVIFVTAARSGNGASSLARRIPLALTAAANVSRDYPVDPNRVWIAGFSGGARVAERMALAFPDLFSGAILDGSSDAIGSVDVPLPPREQFERILDRSSIVFSSGEIDRHNTDSARRVAASLRRHCFDRSSIQVRRRDGHDMMNGRSLAKAFDFLDRPRDDASPRDRQCRDALYAKIDAELTQAEAMVRRGDHGARATVEAIDRNYGGLAAPRSLELRARLGD